MKGRGKLHRAWWMMVGCILLQAGATGVFSNCATIFYSSICGELGFSNGAMAMFTTVRTVTMAFAMTGVTLLYKKIDLRVLLSALSVLGAACFASQALFHDIWQWYVMGAIYGVASGGLMTVPATIVINNWFHERTGFALGLALSASGVAGAVINPLCSALISSLGWRPAAVAVAGLALALLLPATAFILRLTPEEVGCTPYGAKQQNGVAERTVLRAENSPLAGKAGVFALCFILVILPNCVVQITYHISLFVQQEGLSLALAATLTSLVMVGNTLGKLLLGMLNDRKGPWFTSCCACAALALASLGFTGGRAAPWLLYLSAPLLGVSFSLAAMLPSLIARQIYAGQYQKRYSVLMTTGTLLGAVANTAIGVASDVAGSYLPVYGVSAAACAACAALSVLLGAWERKAGPAALEKAVVPEGENG